MTFASTGRQDFTQLFGSMHHERQPDPGKLKKVKESFLQGCNRLHFYN